MNDQPVDFIRLQAALTGRYSLLRELGRGGMGIVYLAQDVALDRPVALKLLQPNLASQPGLKQRFLNEARTAAKLSHPNITPIFAVEEAGDFVFFVMAFVDGETLGQRIRSRGPLPATELARIVRDVGWALAYAHAQGVVHRDVKADNILLERATGRALVVDFGIARVMQDPAVTGAGELIGTADYMSPEQASGEVADHRSDIYSLGIVAYYALSGRLPFEGATASAVLAKQITQLPLPIAESVPGLPSRLGDAVDRCLAKNPGERFASAEELADAAGAALDSRRESPAAIRTFFRSGSEITQGLLWISFLQLTLVLLAGLDSFTPTAVFRDVWLGLAAIALAAEPVPILGMLAHMRRLLRSGYTRDDLVAAWNREVQLGEQERLQEHGRTPGLLERVTRAAVPFGWACMIGSVALGGATSSDAVFSLAFLGLVSSGLGSLVSLWRYEGRTGLSQRLTGWLVKSRLGKWAFRLAGIGLDRSALASLATQRPTELAIGMAVDSLFAALPEPSRRQLSELPLIVRRLEADALKIRQKVEQLDDAVLKLSASRGQATRRESLDRDLHATRDAARQRLADAVGALETIRLDLLRLTAGAGNVDSLTANLSEARALSEDVGRLLEAREEVETSLLPRARRRASLGEATPRQTPA